MSNEVSGSSTTNDGSTAGGSSADGRVASPTRMSLNAPTSGTSHTDPNMGTTSSVCEPDASTSVASDLVDLERRKLPFPPMRQVVDPDKQMKLRAHTGLNSGGGSSRHGGSSVGRGSRSQKSTSTGGGVKPYRAPLSVSVGGVNLGTITSVAGPLTLDATTGQPTIVVGVRAPTPTTAGTPLSWQLTQPFDADASESLPPPPSNRIDTQQPQPTATFPRVTSPVATPASPNQSATAPVASRAVATPARTPGTKKPAKPTPTSSLTGAALATQQEPASSAANVASPDKGSVLSGASNSSPMKPLRLGSTVGSDDEREHHEARLRYSESQASIELLAQQAQQLLDREEAATVDRNPSSGDLDSQTSDFSTGSPHLFATQWSSALDDEVMKMLTMDLVPSFAELHERHTMVKRVIECYKLALQHVIPGRFDVKFCIVGSVQSRTCLPDGDNDVAVFVYPHPDCPYNAPLADALRGNIHVLGADLMARARDHMIGFPGINVESLVFAEVRLLKLVVDGMNVDLTAGQIGGYTASAFVSEVDKFIGYEHRFRYALMLVKAWCLHDARVIGGAGGYLSTYAIATILIAVFNQLYRDGPPPQRELQPLRILLHFLRYCAEFDFEHQVLTMYGPVRLENVQRFIDELPRQQERDGANPRAKVGWSLVDRCLRKYSGYLPPDQSTHGTPTPPHAFSPSPSGTSTPPSMMGSSPQFPLRPMNIMDPLKPLNNLTRGVNLSHMHRISGAFRRGYDVLSRLVERHSNEPMRVIEVFFKGVLDALEQYPSSDRSVPENAVKCKRCSRSTVFCTDMDYMERMGYDVTSPPISVTSNTVFGYEVARRMPPQAHASPTGAMPTYPVHHQHHHHHLQHHPQHHHHHHHHHHHSYPPQQHQPQQSMHRGNGSYMNIPPGHHAMPHYVQHQQRHHTPHGAMQQPPLGHTSSMGQHQHLPPAVLSTSKSARQSPSGPVGSHPMPSQPSPHNSPSAGWQQQHQMQQQASPSTSAQGVANAGSSGFRGAPGASTYGAGLRTEREPRGGGFTTHATHRTPRDFDVNRRNSGSAANIAAAASHPPSPPLLDMTTSPSLPPATNGIPLPQPAAGQRYLPPHTRKPDQAGDAGSAPPHNHERRR